MSGSGRCSARFTTRRRDTPPTSSSSACAIRSCRTRAEAAPCGPGRCRNGEAGSPCYTSAEYGARISGEPRERAMPGYVVLSVEVLDAERYKEYARMGPPTVTQYGGRYLVRGGPVELRSGSWEP